MTDNTAVWQSLSDNAVFTHFADFVKTPRSSGNEAAMQQHVADWAAGHGWRVTKDATQNICVHVPGRNATADAPPVIIQNHTDIVVSNAPGTTADAAAANIPLQRANVDAAGNITPSENGGWLLAPQTTLGADNGIGCAMAMAVVEDESISHPPLELIFTVDEEVGLTGALRLDAQALEITGRTLINLDTEDDDELTIGCAGGMDSETVWQRDQQGIPADFSVFKLSVGPTMGGHSGVEIHAGRANAIRLLARILHMAARHASLHLVEIAGGDKRNAIPRTAHAIVALPHTDVPHLQQALTDTRTAVATQFAGRDFDLASVIPAPETADRPSSAFVPTSTRDLIDLLLTIPQGVLGLVPEIPGLVETSNNLAIVETAGDTVTIICNTRSSSNAALDDVSFTLHAAAHQAGANYTAGSRYPGWAPNLSSPVVQQAAELYRELFQAEPKVHAIHAGLECGVLAERIVAASTTPNDSVDSISFGPNIRGNHAPGERVEIASVHKSYELLKSLLQRLANVATR